MQIRHARADDISAIFQIEKGALEAAHWPPQRYREILNDPSRSLLVLEHESTVQGFGVLRVLDGECELENLVVEQNVRRQGLGAQLLRKLIDLAVQSGAAAVFLEVRQSNLAARALYNDVGFVESGRRRGYYREPEEDAILYRYQSGFCPIPEPVRLI